MFDLLSEKFTDIFSNLRGYGRLTEKHINEGLRDVRVALLEADVALHRAELQLKEEAQTDKANSDDMKNMVSAVDKIAKING